MADPYDAILDAEEAANTDTQGPSPDDVPAPEAPRNDYQEALTLPKPPQALTFGKGQWGQPAAPVDPYDALLDAEEETTAGENASLSRAFKESFSANPDVEAKAFKLAKAFGASTGVIRAALPDFEATWEAAQHDPVKWREANPELAKLALERPELGKLVVKDVPLSDFTTSAQNWFGSLGLPESAKSLLVNTGIVGADIARPPTNAPKQQLVYQDAKSELVQGWANSDNPLTRAAAAAMTPVFRYQEASKRMELAKEAHNLMVQRSLGFDTLQTEKRIHDLKLEAVNRDYGEGPVGHALGEVANAAASTVAMLEDAGPLAAAGAVVGGLLGGYGTKSAAGAQAGALEGLSLVGKAGAMLGSSRLEGGSAYLQLLDAKTDDGTPLDETTARGAAAIYSLLAPAIERMSWGSTLKAMGPVGALLERGEKRAALEAMTKDSGFLGIAKTAGKHWLTGATTEAGEEFLQSATEDAVTYFARSHQAGSFQQGGASGAVDFDRALDSAKSGFIGGAGIGAGAVALNLTTQLLARGRAEESGKTVAALAGLADSPTTKAAPEAVAQMVEEATAKNGAPVKALYVEAEAFMRLFQDGKADPQAAISELLGEEGPKLLQEALSTGGRLEVPLATYLERWGGTEVAKQLVEDTTTNPHEESARQIREGDAAIEARSKELVAQYQEEAAVATAPNEAAFVEALEGQLTAQGLHDKKEARTAVATWRAFVRTTSERFGVSAEQLFADYAVTVQQGDNAAATPAFQQAPKVPGASQFLTARVLGDEEAEGISADERARDLYVDPVSGLRNRRGWDESPRVPGKMVAVITSPDVKAINDEPTGGHDTANELLRTIGVALAQVDPQAARSGTNFLLHVGSDAELEAALAAVRAVLPDPSLQVEGALGYDVDKAFKKLDTQVEGKRVAKTLPPRGQTALDLAKLAALKFAASPASIALPSELVGRAAAFGDEQFIQESYYDKDVPGLLSGAGWNATPPKAFVLAMDLVGIKAVNDQTESKDAGNALLRAFGETGMALGGEGLYLARLSGDEYAAKADSVEELERFRDTLKARLPSVSVVAILGTDEIELSPKFRDGIAPKTYGAADRALNAKKRNEAEAAAQNERGGVREGAGEAAFGDSVSNRREDVSNEVAGGKARLNQAPVKGDLSRIVAEHESRLRHEPNERAVAVDESGAVLFNFSSGLPSAVHFTQEHVDFLIASGTAILTHNHPESRSLSVDDILMAMFANTKEMRAITPSGVVWRVVRPAAGWGVESGDVESFKRMRRDLKAADHRAQASAQWQMDAIVNAAGGNPADGTAAKGYTDETWRTITSTELAKALSAFAETRGLGWQVERLEAQPDADVGREDSAGRLATDVPPDPRLNQEAATDTSARGYVEIAREGITKVFRVALNENADLSTFLHESGHVFLEVFADLATRPDAPQGVKEDWATTLRWLGVEGREGIRVEQHEKWARGFEAYLLEGKAPSPELRGAFQRMKKWLTELYRHVAALNVELNDEVRGVFDRLLASEKEIERSKASMGLSPPLFPTFDAAQAAGMDAQAFADYLEAMEAATGHAQQALELRAFKDRLRAQEAWWKEEEANERQAADEEYEAQPARKAQQGLAGKGDLGTSAIALSRAEVVRALGAASAKRFTLAKAGLHPDEVAEVFGYPTGAQMLEAVVALPEKDAWVRATASSRMAEKHPDVFADGAALRERVAKGLHGDFTAKWLLAEWAALRKRVGDGAVPPLEAVKRAAKALADARQVGNLNVGRALAAERSAANKAAQAAAKGNFAQAAVFKQQQLLNMYLYRELDSARDEVDSFLALTDKLAKDKARARLGKASPVYLGAVDALLEGFGLKEVDEGREKPLPGMPEVVAQMQADGATVGFDEEALAVLLGKGVEWEALTVTDMRVVRDALKNIQGAARAKATAILDGKRVDKEELILSLIDDAAKHLPSLGPVSSSESARTSLEKLGGLFSSIDGSLLKPETMVDWLAGGNLASPWFRAIVKPLQDAKAAEADLLKSTIKPILEAFENVPKAVRARFMEKMDGASLFPTHRTDVAAPTRRFEIVVMALNAGNESNLQRLLEGRSIDMTQLKKALDLLTKEEFDWVQSVWDACETLRPLAFDLEERDSGLRPHAIEAQPLVTRHGTYRGGYVPAVYDRRVEAVGERQEGAALAAILDPTFTRPGTSHGHLKARAHNFSGALSLEPANLTTHLAQVAHDIAYREALKSVGGLVLSPDIQATLRERLGGERSKQFLQWLKDVGQMRGAGDTVHAAGLMKLVRAARANTIISVLGYSLPTALGDLSNLAAAVPGSDLKAKHWAAGMLQFARAPLASVEAAEAKSGELRTRRDSLQRDLAKQTKEFTSTGPLSRGPLKWVREYAFTFLEFTDRATSTPIWLGRYRQALADGLPESVAVTTADRTIRKLFPSHSPVDTAAVLRDKGFLGASLMFYGYFSQVYNINRSALHELHTAEDGVDVAKRLPRVAGRLVAFGLATSVAAELLSGRGREEDEEWAQWLLRKLFSGALSSVPFGGDLAQGVEAKLLGKPSNPRASSLVGVATQLGEALYNLPNDDKEAQKRVTALLRSLGPVLGVPISQPIRTGGYLLDAAEGDVEVRNPADAVSGLVYGKRDNQPVNPASALGDVLSGQ